MSLEIKQAYNVAADVYREKYAAIPARTQDIDRTLAYLDKENPFVVELGCSYGREAAYILKKTNWYQGIDISDQFIAIAQTELGEEYFESVDALDYVWPKGIDCVFAFASLLHSCREDLFLVLCRITAALNSNGVVCLSLKKREQYKTEVVDDGVSVRRFYYYNRETILGNTPENLQEVFYSEQYRPDPWFTMILQKQT